MINPLSSNIKYNNYIYNQYINYPQRISCGQSSDIHSSKYKNCNILNNLNNYKPNVITGNKKNKNGNKASEKEKRKYK